MYSLNVDIKKTQKDLLETLSSRSQFVCNNIKTFDFFTLCTTIPHKLLKSRIKTLIQLLLQEERKTKESVSCSWERQVLLCQKPFKI